MDQLAAALHEVTKRLRLAEQLSGRTQGSVQLLAVSKTFPAAVVREAWQAGQRIFGENYVQELVNKSDELRQIDIEWHFIGPLQSNKTRPIAERAQWVHTIDRLKIAERLSGQRPTRLPPLNVCVQVNVSQEPSKSGCSPEDTPMLARQVAALPGLRLRGLMCVAQPIAKTVRVAKQFALLRQLIEILNEQGLSLDTLSMGMSADMELAVREGATMVRVGEAIFGARTYR